MAEEIKELIEKAHISQDSLLERALKVYKKIEDEPFSKEKKARASIYLACDESACTAIRKLPKTKTKILKRVRERTGIKPNLEATNWVDSVCKETNRGEDVARKAKEILEEYRKMDSVGYYRCRPLTNATAAVYIASKLCGKDISQYELQEKVGVTILTIGERYREMTEKLGISLPLSSKSNLYRLDTF